MPKKIDAKNALDRLALVQATQSIGITEIVQNIIFQKPFGKYPFYIFGHKRTIGLDERISVLNTNSNYKNLEEVPEIKLIWQSRLTKPLPQENSMLFRIDPYKEDQVEVIWILPEKEKFDLYQKGKFFQCQLVAESIHDYIHDRKKLSSPHPQDLDEETIREFYKQFRKNNSAKKTNNMALESLKTKKLYIKN